MSNEDIVEYATKRTQLNEQSWEIAYALENDWNLIDRLLWRLCECKDEFGLHHLFTQEAEEILREFVEDCFKSKQLLPYNNYYVPRDIDWTGILYIFQRGFTSQMENFREVKAMNAKRASANKYKR